ncbi:MAG: glycoside hydrolase family 127 protein, partial [Planctomycetes bacterium]|nr:glycoside hydrolase family 127 protein [Planctomycetota bacterium]
LWPNMVVLTTLQTYDEWTQRQGGGAGSGANAAGDARIIPFMQRYFRWQLDYPEQDFLLPFWQQQRAADNLASVYWLYTRTGEPWLLDLARKIHRRTANWTDGVANWHGVNISQSFRGPAVYWQQSGEERHRLAPYHRYDAVMNLYGQVPGGMFAADENARKGMTDPRQAAESCTMVEFMYSFEQLLAITGDSLWADRCEEIAFNSLPAAMTADFRAVRYLTSPNMISSDAASKAPGYENGGPMQLFDPRDHRCCQHNVGHGWPYFAEHLWMATADNGVAAVLYAPSEARVYVGSTAAPITLRTETHYPFEDEIKLTVQATKAVRFPLYFRVPRWSGRVWLSVNGGEEWVNGADAAGRFVRTEREWRDGDRVRLVFERSLRCCDWPRQHDSVSIAWGPLEFALDLDEQATRVRPDDVWHATELRAGRAWNFGFDQSDLNSLLETFQIRRRDWPRDDQPFTPASTPVFIEAPVRAGENSARLRISQFPQVCDGPQAHAWTPPPMPAKSTNGVATASACWREDTLSALDDGLEPESSEDYNVPRFTWWPRKGGNEWVQLDFPAARAVSEVQLYWFDDSQRGRCRAPASWRLFYKPSGAAGGAEWRPVKLRGGSEFGKAINAYNIAWFEPVETTALRIEAALRPEFCAGILEWRVK